MMKTTTLLSFYLICIIVFSSNVLFAQLRKDSVSLFSNKDMTLVNVLASEETYLGKRSLKITDNGNNTELKFLKIGNLNFSNGIIEIDISGKPAQTSSKDARGFVGIAFRIADDNSRFECIYLRPTNGRAEEQERRNHSVQYISYPDFPWHKLRKDFPEKYESYVDLQPGEWTKIKIEVEGNKAKLYVHGNSQPTLIINDLKLGTDINGSIGLWIGPGTEAHFSNAYVYKKQ
ncbi:hypothetical protein [Pedobacter steynii]|nr:hypothetical protein [Pedobacter steynii]